MNKPFLTIEMDDLTKVPTVTVNDQRIENVINVGIDWSARGESQSIQCISISYYESPQIKKTVSYEVLF
ncbi:hypothetical protein CVD25_06475 [Bacillus canaveralius]|uniref:Uncharacterized protein n=1 Tax=Bacillus canaveralius TaxID=1403243 RepID=A0A2N5GG52_9BACI|nr:hypothetical protein [Bacillus canaveralius]PLR79705.1 hypothetical protein CU635_21670 [Bacillus canaveralius]PLR99163.1 hypothetical protein CVD25_06475 [Bacillus canaveralius]